MWLSQHLAGVVDEPDYAHVISFSTRALLSLGESIEVFVCYLFCTFYFLLFPLSPLLQQPRETIFFLQNQNLLTMQRWYCMACVVFRYSHRTRTGPVLGLGNLVCIMARLDCRKWTRIRITNPMATLHCAEHFTLHRLGTRILQESDSVPISEFVSSNVNETMSKISHCNFLKLCLYLCWDVWLSKRYLYFMTALSMHCN